MDSKNNERVSYSFKEKRCLSKIKHEPTLKEQLMKEDLTKIRDEYKTESY